MSRIGMLATALAVWLVAVAPASAQSQDVLPDLDQEVPTGIEVRAVETGAKTSFHLGFDSAAANVGDGPLMLHGRRRSPKAPTMTVDQIVTQTAGLPRMVRGVGRMSYVVHPDHRHWHLLGFERYELRVPGDDRSPLRRDRKTGFCLGDRYPIYNAAALPGFSRIPVQGDTCGMGLPGLMGLFAGISVGYGDRYKAHIEGQYIDITGLPGGMYTLVHTVNTDGRIVERDYTNNASSLLISITWPRGARALPAVRELRRCPATDACLPPMGAKTITTPRSPA